MSIVEYSKNLHKILHWFDYSLLHELLRASIKQEISKRAGCIFVYNDNTSHSRKSKPTRGGEISKRPGWQKQEAQR